MKDTTEQNEKAGGRYRYYRSPEGEYFRTEVGRPVFMRYGSDPEWFPLGVWEKHFNKVDLIETDEHGTALALPAPPADAPAKDAGETPRVDAEAFQAEIGDWGKGEFVPADFARTLEREAAALRVALAAWEEAEKSEAEMMVILGRAETTHKQADVQLKEHTANWKRAHDLRAAALADGKGEKPCAEG